MQPDPTNLLHRIDVTIPLIGFYDAPDPSPFEPLIKPAKGNCAFDFFKTWLAGKTLHITEEHYGCPGAGNSLLGIEAFPRDQLVDFLVDKEGLKASKELMMEWLKHRNPYQPANGNILIGPLRPDQWDYLKTVTFIVNPDQLSAVMTGAHYNAGPNDPTPVIAPFGSGCSLLVPFDDFDVHQASIGSTDMAMREHIRPDQNLFTVTRPMFKQLCELDETSFLYKEFWGRLRKSRGLPNL